MSGKWLKRIIGAGLLLAIVAAFVYALLPQPVGVDLAVIDRGLVEVTIDEEGVARIRDVFRVSTPVGGKVERLPLQTGDVVSRDSTTVALIKPAEPPFVDARSRRELEASVAAARAGIALADEQRKSAASRLALAETNEARALRLLERGLVTKRAYDESATTLATTQAELKQMEANLSLHQSELAAAEARLLGPDTMTEQDPDSCCVIVTAPADGVVLAVLSESEQVLPAGAPLVEIGDPRNIEIAAHFLSSDAVLVSPGMVARLDEWGGPALEARVSQVNPAAYTKVSALGIEEQRVDVILDPMGSADAWQRLGHGFKVMIHVPVSQRADAVRVPIGALFRHGSDWQVYRVVDERAVLTRIGVGQRNNQWAEVLEGLSPGDQVILHPSDRVADGVAVEMF